MWNDGIGLVKHFYPLINCCLWHIVSQHFRNQSVRSIFTMTVQCEFWSHLNRPLDLQGGDLSNKVNDCSMVEKSSLFIWSIFLCKANVILVIRMIDSLRLNQTGVRYKKNEYFLQTMFRSQNGFDPTCPLSKKMLEIYSFLFLYRTT